MVNNPAGRFRLQTVLIIPFVILIAATVGLAGYLAFLNGQNAVQDLAGQLHQEAAFRVEEHLDSYLGTPHLVNGLNLDAIRLDKVDPGNPDDLIRVFIARSGRFDTAMSIAYADQADGHYVGIARIGVLGEVNGTERFLAISNKSTNFTLVEYLIGGDGRRIERTWASVPAYDPRTRPWYQAAVAAGGPAWTPVFTWSQGTIGLDAVLPVSGADGRLSGVLDTSLTLDGIGEFLHTLNVTPNARTFILERSSGGIIASSAGNDTPVQSGSGLVLLPGTESSDPVVMTVSQYLEQNYGQPAVVPERRQFYLDIAGERQFVQVSPYRDRYGLDWLIVTVIPESDFMGRIDANNRTTGLVIVVSLLGSILLCIVIARWISRPILRMNESAKALARGDWSQKAEPDRGDEIGELAGSLNTMAGQLERSFTSLRESEERYRALYDDNPSMYFTVDPSGIIVSVNAYGCSELGYPREELVGRPIVNLFHPEDRDAAMEGIRQSIAGPGTVFHWELRKVRRDGTVVWVREIARALHGTDGKITVLIVCEDITDWKMAENALGQATRKLNLLNSLVFNTIRNAIFSLSGYLELERRAAGNGKPAQYVEREIGIVRTISGSLEFADTYENLGLKPPLWQNVAQSFVMAASHLDTRNLNRQIDIGGLEIYADPLLEKVFFALLENVIDHAGTATGIRLWHRETPEGLILVFEDNGPGIPPAIKEKIFARKYEQTRGMGLFLAREILEITGITMIETGISGKGARFEIHVPKGTYRFTGS